MLATTKLWRMFYRIGSNRREFVQIFSQRCGYIRPYFSGCRHYPALLGKTFHLHPTARWQGIALFSNNSNQSNDLGEGKGKLSPTSSRLFRLTLPLESFSSPPKRYGDAQLAHENKNGPTVFLLHPFQPLSYISHLILASIKPASPIITFRSASLNGQVFQWSDSTNIGDFIRDAARSSTFSVHFGFLGEGETKAYNRSIAVEIPRFADRTRFLRRRLEHIHKELNSMESLKLKCDHEARQGARRMAVGGFGMLVVYWAAVARLTFWDYGWDVMEPITYLSGLTTVICGYLWFLYQGREVSYTSVLDRSISARREALYRSRGLDIEHWRDLTREARNLRREIMRIAEDYDEDGKVKEDESIKFISRGKDHDNEAESR